MKRATVQIDRKALLDALAAVERALVRGDTAAALKALGQVYRVVQSSQEPPARARVR